MQYCRTHSDKHERWMACKRRWQACQELCSMELHCFSSQLLEHLDTLQDHVPQVRGCAAIIHIACT